MVRNFMTVKVFQCVLCLFFLHIALTSTQLASVTRNITDSFRGENTNCKEEPGVCSRRNAVCQQDGSCGCKDIAPDYVNPQITVVDGYLSHGGTDGCMSLSSVINSLDPVNIPCSYSFWPYQLMPNRRSELPTTFVHPSGSSFSTCNFTSALAKYPGNKTWTPLTWLTKNYVDINITFPGYLDVWWRMPVPKLRGLMIVINMDCLHKNKAFGRTTFTRNFTDPVSKQCLRAKVLGTFSSTATSLASNLITLIYFASLSLIHLDS